MPKIKLNEWEAYLNCKLEAPGRSKEQKTRKTGLRQRGNSNYIHSFLWDPDGFAKEFNF